MLLLFFSFLLVKFHTELKRLDWSVPLLGERFKSFQSPIGMECGALIAIDLHGN